MLLEAAWKAVHLTQVLYLWLKNYGQESRLKILNQISGSVLTGIPDSSAAKQNKTLRPSPLTLMAYERQNVSQTTNRSPFIIVLDDDKQGRYHR